MKESVDVVVVTFNRLEKLKHTLECYENQIVKFRNLIVVDNHSTDETPAFLEKWKSIIADYGKYVLTLNENLGGAGGFYEGQKFAVSLNPDWVFLADDDAYPADNLMEKFYSYLQNHNEELKKVVALCTSVSFPNGQLCYDHRSRLKMKFGLRHSFENCPESDYNRDCFCVDFFSYVGAIVKVDVLKKVGYDNPHYFIYYDDKEHCMRLRKFGLIVCVPELKIIHDSGWTESENNMNELISWRNYYGIRNGIHMLKKHYFVSAIWYTLNRLYRLVIMNREYTYQCKKMIVIAIIDAWTNRLGKHRLYKPGWSVSR